MSEIHWGIQEMMSEWEEIKAVVRKLEKKGYTQKQIAEEVRDMILSMRFTKGFNQ